MDGMPTRQPLTASRITLGGDDYVIFELEPRRAPWPPALTASEREVAELVVDGCSNREIGDRRARSARTVANQVASIFQKLGVGSRAELMARFGGSRR